jgi:hypothetical protein
LNVQDGDIGLELLDQVLGGLAIASFGDNLDVTGMFQYLANTGSDDGVIVGK